MLVCVGIPSIDGKVCAQTVDSLLAEQVLGHGQGVHFLVMWELGCSLIGVARNRLARRFLDTPQAQCMVFVDADISWKGGELARLARQPHDVIGGTYRAKKDDVQFHVRHPMRPTKNGLRVVEGLPGGFLKISRKAFERTDANPYKNTNGQEMRDYFPTGYHDGEMWGEDYGFCRLYRQSGGTVWLDPSIKLRHHDGNRAFSGDVNEWLESINGN